jgi:Flp pilus assembly protein TadD/phage shock protein PspC (stress-responsive transcriptional regulator)
MSNGKPKPAKNQGKPAPGQSVPQPHSRQLTKSKKDAVLAGVCSGLGHQTNLPAWVWRLIFLLGMLLVGLGALTRPMLLVGVPVLLLTILAYLGLWIGLPRDKTPQPVVPPLFRRIDWISFAVTTLLVFIGYYLTLAPDLTLEDSGELAVGSFYAGVPHPPGYPVWTMYTWLFTVLVPFSNIAWRVALSSAVAGALACGLIALLASRGSSMILESIEELKNIEKKWENALCMMAGYVAGMLIGFNGFMWSQAVIVEVYTFSLLSLLGMLCFLLRWIHAPDHLRYLYWALFLFGICFTNHMTLIVAAMGIEVAILAAKPKLGRDVFLGNGLVYGLGLFAKANGMLTSFDSNIALFGIYNLVGIVSLYVFLWYSIKSVSSTKWTMILVHFAVNLLVWYLWAAAKNKGVAGGMTDTQFTAWMIVFNPVLIVVVYGGFLLSGTADLVFREWPVAVLLLVFWVLGISFYFFMPIASSTNPPLNWGYPRTWEGFLHALTRGQYEKTNPTSSLGRFFEQLNMLLTGAVDEFNLTYLFIALVPFFFYKRMQRREQSWLQGLVVMYLCLAVLLIVLLNPSSDRQSEKLNRVFFTASHVMISLCIGYGLALFGGLLVTQYKRFRAYGVYGGAVATAISIFALTVVLQGDKESLLGNTALFGLEPSLDPLVRFTAWFSLGLSAAVIVVFVAARRRAPMIALLGLFAVVPVKSILSHWADNEQRGHLFGYWFGHDMFTPPFVAPDGRLSYDAKLREEAMKGPDAKLVYPEMARDAILFGGTDPGRFCPTYMIFCESFIPPEKKKDTDPDFNRRDVYIITQNALADGTYLEYIRAHYNRSTQDDRPFFQEMLRTKQDGVRGMTNFVSRKAYELLDVPLTKFGKKIEDRRRAECVYPPNEIQTPTPEEHQKCFNDYMMDASRRMQLNQLKPGEDVKIDESNGRLSVSGQVAVMAINGLLTKVIFDRNPSNEFYVEESFPLDWMYRHLEPYGIIMKINRQPLPEINEEMIRKDHEFWSRYSDRLIGNWITYDTPVKEICDFVERLYLRKDYKGFKGDPKFVRDDQAQKSFSKLRSSIGGVYSWRVTQSRTPAEQQRMFKEADFALRQAFAYCPHSPEAVQRYAMLLANFGRLDDALLVTETSLKFDRDNPSIQYFVNQIRSMKERQPQLEAAQQGFFRLEEQFRTNPTDAKVGFDLASAYLQRQQTSAALTILDQLVNSPQADANTLLSVASALVQLQQGGRLESVLKRLVTVRPDSAEAWYDLASTQAILGKSEEAIQSLRKAIESNDKRLARQPGSGDLRKSIATNQNFTALRSSPAFQKLLGSP